MINDFPNIPYKTAPNDYGGAWQRYVEHGISPGSFGEAILADDWGDAQSRADAVNIRLIEAHAKWVSDNLPRECHGDWQTVQRWMKNVQSGSSYGFIKAAFKGRVAANDAHRNPLSGGDVGSPGDSWGE